MSEQITSNFDKNEIEWLPEAAIEVGLSDSAALEEVMERRKELADSLGMSDLSWDGWSNEHGRAARIATDLGTDTIDATELLGSDTLDLLETSVRSTYSHAPGLLPEGHVDLRTMKELRDERVAQIKAHYEEQAK